ncbi:MAG: CGGC domain-containing protein [Syntrophomonadaceae bacterium]|jgi:predicted metal-binding protein|nr:CGGC domain-containing protein [Syntrophomonadaceae bacterium]
MSKIEWKPDALEELKKVPGFVRPMARRAVESYVRERGRTTATAEDVQAARDQHIRFAEDDKSAAKKTRIAIVRCETVAEVCPGVACFKAFNQRHAHFAQYDKNTEIIGFFTCGGCSGRRVSRMVDKLVDHGLDVVHLSSCLLLEGDYPRCPHKAQIKKNIEAKGIRVVEGTHH